MLSYLLAAALSAQDQPKQIPPDVAKAVAVAEAKAANEITGLELRVSQLKRDERRASSPSQKRRNEIRNAEAQIDRLKTGRLDPPDLNPLKLQIGEIGTFRASITTADRTEFMLSYRFRSALSDQEMAIDFQAMPGRVMRDAWGVTITNFEPDGVRRTPFIIRGLATAGRDPGTPINLSGSFRVVGTRIYGSGNSFVLEPFDLGPYLERKPPKQPNEE